ncbi:hypothetical protein ACLOJK_015527, partial [Asimina triloba]
TMSCFALALLSIRVITNLMGTESSTETAPFLGFFSWALQGCPYLRTVLPRELLDVATGEQE